MTLEKSFIFLPPEALGPPYKMHEIGMKDRTLNPVGTALIWADRQSIIGWVA